MKQPNNAYLQRKGLRAYRSGQVVAFFVVLYAVFVVSLILPLRPTRSDTENRDLRPFPTFSFSSFWSGQYFSEIGLWFSDTFPFRDSLIKGDAAIQNLYGIQTDMIHGEVVKGDEIPDRLDLGEEEPPVSNSTTSTLPSTGESTGSTSKPTTKPTEEPPFKEPEGQQLGAIYLTGDAAYEYYTFNEGQSVRYVKFLNKVGNALSGKAQVYSLIAPNSMGVMMADSKKITSSNQRDAINAMTNSLNKNVKGVKLFDVLKKHRKEYLYFRTDHHWTSNGAYYAYQEFAKAKGIKPNPLSSFEKAEYKGFLGTFYAGSNQSNKLGDNPDTVVTYTPKATNSMTITDRNGTVFDWPVVMDGDQYGASSKYSVFIGGDNPYSVISNPTLTDGSSCVVIKESYGNAFVPFLVDHYQTVHVIDYRYYSGNLVSFVEENKVQDVIILNNIMATSTSLRIDDLEALLQ